MGFYGTRTCPGFVQGAPRAARGRRGRGVGFGRLMGKDRSPESKVQSLKSAGGNAVRRGEKWFLGKPPKATSKPPQSVLIARR